MGHEEPEDGLDAHGDETHKLFIRAIVMLGLILVSMNLNGFLKKRNIHYLGESAVIILLGNSQPRLI